MADAREYPPPYVELAFGDGVYLFKLGLEQIAELQAKCGAGLGLIFSRVLKGRYVAVDSRNLGNLSEAEWFVADLLETIRLALIGGDSGLVDGQQVKVSPQRARELIAAYVFPARPLAEAWTLATAILTALIVGYDAGEAGDEKKKARVKPTPKGRSTSRAR